MSIKHMNKRTRSLVYAVIALVAVGALLAAVLLLLPDNEQGTDDPIVDNSVMLWDKSENNAVHLLSADVTIAGKKHTISYADKETYKLEGYDDLPQDDYNLSAFADTMLTVNATRLIHETPENPTDFGFDKTNYGTTVTATFSDDTAFSFEIGDVAPSGEGCYLRVADKPAIYLIDLTFCDTVCSGPFDYLNWAPITAPEATETTDKAVVRDVTLGGTVRNSKIFFQIEGQVAKGEVSKSLSGYIIQKPYFHSLDKECPLLNPTTFSSLYADGVAAIRPTNADLAKYGLNNPYSTCDVNMSIQRTVESVDEDDEVVETISYHGTFNYTIKFGKQNADGQYYTLIYAEGKLIPIVYLFSYDSVNWVDDQYSDMTDNLMFFQYITNLKQFALTVDGNTTTFDLKHHPDAEESDDKLTVIANNKTYSTADFRTVYATLLGIYRTGEAEKAPTGTPLLSLTCTPTSADIQPTTVDIYPYSAGWYLAKHNTGEIHLVNAKDVEETLTVCRKFLAGEKLK